MAPLQLLPQRPKPLPFREVQHLRHDLRCEFLALHAGDGKRLAQAWLQPAQASRDYGVYSWWQFVPRQFAPFCPAPIPVLHQVPALLQHADQLNSK
jgi:hypothetical protein